jgi:hypothetical protein
VPSACTYIENQSHNAVTLTFVLQTPILAAKPVKGFLASMPPTPTLEVTCAPLKQHSTLLKQHSTLLKQLLTPLKQHSTPLKQLSTLLKQLLTPLKQLSTLLKQLA